jgi:ribonuclease HI
MATKVFIFTDGASLGNPGPGGYGTILKYGLHTKELSGGFRRTTNNRMELLAVIEGLKALKKEGLEVEVYSDSQYVVNSVEKRWVFTWQKNAFKGKKNPDLWKEFLELNTKFRIKFRWIKGHAGHPENERCDILATHAAINPQNIDTYYERYGENF